MSHVPKVGVGVLILKGEKILLLKRKGAHSAGEWSPPGGHLEFGESFEECALRETREETGLAIDNVRFIALTNDIFRESDLHYITIWMEGGYVWASLLFPLPTKWRK
jgi:8-oxo-dGTP diphosphatase